MKKRILTLLLCLSMLLSLAACASSSLEETMGEETKTEAVENKNDKTDSKDKIVYPEGFSVGYARADITPTESVPIYDADSTGVRDPLYLTCTAVCDGETVALLMSADLKGIQHKSYTQVASIIEKEFGIPSSNVIISATHTHSAHSAGAGNDTALVRWSGLFYKQAKAVVEQALRDLAPAEAYVGVSHTEDLTFVRRYKLANGTYKTNPSATDKPVEHESEADNELRTIRFDRGDKKDILMVNYQTHYGYYTTKLSADFVGLFRDQAEEEWDAHFVYYSGASGNLNFNSAISGERKYGSVPEGMVELMDAAKKAISSEEKVNTGKVIVQANQYEIEVLKDSPEKVAQAKEISKYEEGSEKYNELMGKYNLGSARWVNAIVVRAGLGDTQKIPFHAISFGDLAFSTSPIEQFDKSAKDVRAASPFKMTFTCSLTNGSFGYVPTAEAFPHGGYEVMVCRYIPGCGERFANEQIRLLNLCKDAA